MTAVVASECLRLAAGVLATGKPVKIRKAIGERVLIPDDGTALALAVQFKRAAEYSSETLLRLWPKAADPDGFCATHLAPAFALHQSGSGINAELRSALDVRELPTQVDRDRALLGHVMDSVPSNPLAPRQGTRRRHPKMPPDGARPDEWRLGRAAFLRWARGWYLQRGITDLPAALRELPPLIDIDV